MATDGAWRCVKYDIDILEYAIATFSGYEWVVFKCLGTPWIVEIVATKAASKYQVELHIQWSFAWPGHSAGMAAICKLVSPRFQAGDFTPAAETRVCLVKMFAPNVRHSSCSCGWKMLKTTGGSIDLDKIFSSLWVLFLKDLVERVIFIREAMVCWLPT